MTAYCLHPVQASDNSDEQRSMRAKETTIDISRIDISTHTERFRCLTAAFIYTCVENV